MKKTLLIIFVLVSIKAYSQQNTFTWVFYDSLQMGIEARSMVRTPDKGYMIAGKSTYSNGYILRLDSSGNFLWNKSYSNSVLMEFNCITATNDSCFVIAGNAYNTVSNNNEAFCGKINATGDTLWQTTISYAGNSLTAVSVRQTNDSGYIITGNSSTNATSFTRIFVAKISQAGNLQWSNLLTSATYANMGNVIKQDNDSNYILSGSVMDGSPLFQQSACLIKLSQSGSVLWAKKYYLPVSSQYVKGNDFEFTNDGIVVNLDITGNNALMKTDLSGNVLWSNAYCFSGGGATNFFIPKIKLTADSSFVVLSGGSFDAAATKIDSAGNVIWSSNLNIIPTDISETENKEIFILGNGPQWGVKGIQVLSPQIGIIQADSSGNSPNCIYQNIFTPAILSMNSANITVTSLAGLTEDTIQTAISSLGLVINSGCVDHAGGINENEANHITILPNPSSGIFTIVTTERKTDALIIYDILGKEIYKTAITDNKTTIDLSSYPKGIYYCRILSKNKNVSVGQIVVIE